MEITESRRLEMEQQFQRKFGMDVSDTIMGHLPPNGWHNIATTADIVGLHTEIELLRAATTFALFCHYPKSPSRESGASYSCRGDAHSETIAGPERRH